MSSDSVRLVIDGQGFEAWESYEISADMYAADAAFRLTAAKSDIDIQPGRRFQLFVNGVLEMTGVIDSVTASYAKGESQKTIVGRDLMGVVVDAYVEQFETVQGLSIKALAQRLLRDLPFISVKDVVYSSDISWVVSNSAYVQLEPGATVFETLSNAAAAKGAMFYCQADGALVFGKPKSAGKPLYHAICRLDGRGNNVLTGEFVNDISKRYRKIIVTGQAQGDSDGVYNVMAVREDAQFPLPRKTMVVGVDEDRESPTRRAVLTMEQQRRDGYQVRYTVAGHSYQGRNWAINELCQVTDHRFKIGQALLIYGRVFRRAKDSGSTTDLVLGLPGLR
jgi:prophage tail gpP-like protein